ncbi:Mpo1-like protein [Dyella sp.]|uniref:Mpo1-like protein n=1 Tax=Dyella sp. TaxID=1869338 RepID=UPI002ED522FA
MSAREEHARRLAYLLEQYSLEHRRQAHRVLAALCVPLVLWSAIAVIWTIPVPPSLGQPGFWSVMLQIAVFAWYWKHSQRLGIGMLGVLIGLSVATHFMALAMEPPMLRQTGLVVLVLAWAGLFAGRLLEYPRPSLRSMLATFFIGPAWLLDGLLRRLGMS